MLWILLCCKEDPITKTSAVDPYDVQVGPYSTNIRWTDYGIPHIKAEDYGSLGYGMGYALAKDHYCTLLDQIVRIRGERAQHHGSEFVDEDFGWRAFNSVGYAEEGFFSIPERVQTMLIGYAAGVNRYLEEDELPLACKDSTWIRPITHIDLLSYYLALGLKASGENLVAQVGSAQPPSAIPRPEPPAESLEEVLLPFREPEWGSNGWAIGKEKTAHRGGLLFSNTHFPFFGERRWHESHLTIPGELDVYGSSLIGVAAINIGFNEHVAWTHTVSTNPRFVVYNLELKDGKPTEYLYDGTYRKMEAHDFDIEVLQDDGSLQTVERTLYRSHYGWMLNAPTFGWPDTVGFTFKDANENNLNMLATWFDMNRATSMEEFQIAQENNRGIPWVHTLAADKEGQVWFIDSAATPNFSKEAEAEYRDVEMSINGFTRIFDDYGVVAVSGGKPVFEWVEEDGARVKGLVPYSKAPQQLREDYVLNANDNHWLTNANAPLEGYPMLYGDERTPRTPRTRMNHRFLLEDNELWSIDRIKQASFSGRSILQEDLRTAVVERCETTNSVTVDFEDEEHTVDLVQACAVLKSWDGTSQLDSTGIHIWRELLGAGIFEFEDMLNAGILYRQAFDPDQPMSTPSNLAEPSTDRDYLLESMGLAVLRLEQAEVEMDAPLSEIQFQSKNGELIPIMGNSEFEGSLAISVYSRGTTTLLSRESTEESINSTTDLRKGGYQVNYGNSWVAAIEMGENGPVCEAILTYSQSSDPTSEHFKDQSTLYAQSEFRPCLFEETDISEAVLVERQLTLE